MFRPAGFLVLQLTDHAYDHLIHALHLTIGLSMVRRGSQFLHSIQFTEVCYHMARKGLPLITDKVGRCTEKPKIPDPQSLGSGTCSLVFHHIRHNVLGEVVLQNQYITDDGVLLQRHCLLDGREVHM